MNKRQKKKVLEFLKRNHKTHAIKWLWKDRDFNKPLKAALDAVNAVEKESDSAEAH